MPGRFAETVGLDDSFEKKILGRTPTLARARQGSDAGQARPGGGQECGALGVGRARTHWASHQTRLGEPVLIGRTRIGRASTHWASPYSLGKPVLGEPSNEVGTRLGEPVLRGRWARVPRVPAWHV